MKKLAMGLAAAGLVAASASASAWWGPGYDRYYGGYAPYYAYAPHAAVPTLTEEQIESQKAAIEAQQKAALEHFQRMEEQRKAMQAPLTEEQIKQMEAQREAMQKAMEERFSAMPGPFADGPFGMWDPMGDAHFKQMEEEREAVRKAMEERRKAMRRPLMDGPYGMRDPMNEEYFKQMEEYRLAMQESMEEQRKAMQKSREEWMKNRSPMWDTPYGPAW